MSGINNPYKEVTIIVNIVRKNYGSMHLKRERGEMHFNAR
jgi:hypothetical protein